MWCVQLILVAYHYFLTDLTKINILSQYVKSIMCLNIGLLESLITTEKELYIY